MAYKAKLREDKKKKAVEDGSLKDDAAETEEEKLKRIKSSYINKQHVMVIACRGITSRYRHLMRDMRDLLPHSKQDVKYDGRYLNLVNEICDMKDCNNCILFEGHRDDLFLWFTKTPAGPSAKFHVTNVHTMSELKFSGNCLKGSRPILHFDALFDEAPHWRLIKEMFIHIFSTPNMHPRSKPFIDHIMNFYICDNRIWFRNYQLSEEHNPDSMEKDKMERVLVEIGPRMVLNPVKILSGSFFGAPIYENPLYVSPAMLRALQTRKKAAKHRDNALEVEKRKERLPKHKFIPPNPLDSVFSEEWEVVNQQEEQLSKSLGDESAKDDEAKEEEKDEDEEGEQSSGGEEEDGED